MHRKSISLCVLTCVTGIFGAFLRWLQLSTAFEEDTGLAIPNALWSIVMAVYLIVAATAFILVVRSLKKDEALSAPTGFPDAFRGEPSICSVMAFLSGLVILAGGVLTVMGAIGEQQSAFDLINGIFACCAAVCVLIVLRSINSATARGGAGSLIIIVLYLCFRLIDEYQVSASDPVIWNFAIRILAVSAMIMAYYYYAGYCFNKAKPYRALYFSMLSLFLSVTTIADNTAVSYKLITAGLCLAQLMLTLLLVENMEYPSCQVQDSETQTDG